MRRLVDSKVFLISVILRLDYSSPNTLDKHTKKVKNRTTLVGNAQELTTRNCVY
jgi:hypothetical protein